MTQLSGFASADDSAHPEPAADDQVLEPAPVAIPEGSGSPTSPAWLGRKAVRITIAAVLGVVLVGAGVGTGIAISGSHTGSAATNNAGAGGALRFPDKLLGLDRNTYTRTGGGSFPAALVAHQVSGLYGAGLPRTPFVAIGGGRLTRAGQSETHFAPAVALNWAQFPGSTDAQEFPAGRAGAGIACAYFSDKTFGTQIACYSIDQTTVFQVSYGGGVASSLRDAAAKTIQIRQALER